MFRSGCRSLTTRPVAPCGCAPVDRAHPVTGDVFAEVCVLDRLRPSRARPRCRRRPASPAARGCAGALRRAGRPSGAADGRTIVSQPRMRKRLRARTVMLADVVSAPSRDGSGARDRSYAPRPCSQPEGKGIGARPRPRLRRAARAATSSRSTGERDRTRSSAVDAVPLDDTLGAERERDVELEAPGRGRSPSDEHKRERSRHDRELGSPHGERCDQADARENRVALESRAGEPRHLGGREVLGLRRRNARENVANDVLGRDPLHPELGAQDEPVRERRDGDRLDVVGKDVVPTLERGPRPRELDRGRGCRVDSRRPPCSATLGSPPTRSTQ